MKQCKLHNEFYVCQMCGDCYPCSHKLIEDHDGSKWWVCRYSNIAHTTDRTGKPNYKKLVEKIKKPLTKSPNSGTITSC